MCTLKSIYIILSLFYKYKVLPYLPYLYYLYYFIYVFSAEMLLVSFTCEVVHGESFISMCSEAAGCKNSIFSNNILNNIFLIPLSAPEIIIKTVGVCSFFISFILQKMSDKEYGITYADLLNEKKEIYIGQVIIHFSSALLGLWMVKAGWTEGTYIACIVVLLGIFPQCKLLYILLLDKEERRKRIIKKWETKYSPEEILILADQVTLENLGDFPELLDVFVNNFYRFCDNCNIRTSVLYQINCIWERILVSPNSTDDILKMRKRRIFEKIVSFLRENKCDEKVILYLSAGYCLYLFKSQKNSDSVIQDVYRSVLEIENDIRDIDGANNFLKKLKMCFSIVSFIGFSQGKTNYSYEYISFARNVKVDINDNNISSCINDLIKCLYPTWDGNLEIAVRLLF